MKKALYLLPLLSSLSFAMDDGAAKRAKVDDSSNEYLRAKVQVSNPSPEVDWSAESAYDTLVGLAHAQRGGTQEAYLNERAPVPGYLIAEEFTRCPPVLLKSLYFDEPRTGELHRDSRALYFKVKDVCISDDESIPGCVSIKDASRCLGLLINQPASKKYAIRFSKFKVLDETRSPNTEIIKSLFNGILQQGVQPRRLISLYSLLSYFSLTAEEFKRVLPRFAAVGSPIPLIHRVNSDTHSQAITNLLEYIKNSGRQDFLSELLRAVHPSEVEKAVKTADVAAIFMSNPELFTNNDDKKYDSLIAKCRVVLSSGAQSGTGTSSAQTRPMAPPQVQVYTQGQPLPLMPGQVLTHVPVGPQMRPTLPPSQPGFAPTIQQTMAQIRPPMMYHPTAPGIQQPRGIPMQVMAGIPPNAPAQILNQQGHPVYGVQPPAQLLNRQGHPTYGAQPPFQQAPGHPGYMPPRPQQ